MTGKPWSWMIAGIVLLFAAPAWGQRTLSPGVLTTIPPKPEEEEMFSGPRPIEPVAIPGLEITPKLAPKTNTVFERAKIATLRRTIWNLEFSFKPMRLIDVDMPQPTGVMQRKLVWYMVFRVRNLGGHFEPRAVEEIFQDKIKHITWTKSTTNEVEFFGAKTTSLRFFPHFVLESREVKKSYLSRVIPAAHGPIRRREFPGDSKTVLHDVVSITGAAIPVSTATEDHSVWGVVTWEEVDPKIDYFSVYVQGLTNAYRYQDPANFAPSTPGSGRTYTTKTLQLNFWRPGDAVEAEEEEFRYGVRIVSDPNEQKQIFDLYNITERLDHLWVYR